MGFCEPFQHGVTDHQIIRFGQLAEQLLPGGLNEGRALPCIGKALACAVEHGFGRFGQRYLMPVFGQPQRHMAQPGTDIQDAQRPVRQDLDEVSLQNGQADGTFGAAIDFFGETGREQIEMTVAHLLKRRSLSASLLRTT